MITGELKSKIDRVWDAFWSGGISNPLEVIEQITYLLFIRRLDDLQTLAEKKAHRTGKQSRASIFGPDQQDLRWSRFKNDEPAVMYKTVADEVFPFLRTLGGDGSTYSEHMKDARFTIPTPALLSQGRRHARRHPDGRPRHQRRPVRVPAVQDRHGRRQRPVPHAAAHHRADGGDDRATAV